MSVTRFHHRHPLEGHCARVLCIHFPIENSHDIFSRAVFGWVFRFYRRQKHPLEAYEGCRMKKNGKTNKEKAGKLFGRWWQFLTESYVIVYKTVDWKQNKFLLCRQSRPVCRTTVTLTNWIWVGEYQNIEKPDKQIENKYDSIERKIYKMQNETSE